MGMSKEDFIDTCSWMAEETAEEIRGLQIPIDKPGTRIMYTVNAREPMYLSAGYCDGGQDIYCGRGRSGQCPAPADFINPAVFAGDNALGGQIVKNMYTKAVELGVQATAITECGHAYRSAAFEGPYMLGYRSGKHSRSESSTQCAFFMNT